MNYPCWMYHADKGARIFYDEESFAEAGKGWADSPEKAIEIAIEIAPDVLKPGEPYTTTKRVPRGNRS